MTHLNVSLMRPATLAAVMVCVLLGAPAEALPLPVTSIGTPATATGLLTPLTLTETGLRSPDPLGTLQPAFRGEARDPDLQLSFAIQPRDGSIIVSVRSADPLGTHGPRIAERAGDVFTGHAPIAPPTAALLIGSGLVSAGVNRRRRRGPRRLDEIAIPSHPRKEVSGKAPVAPSRTASGANCWIPLRI